VESLIRRKPRSAQLFFIPPAFTRDSQGGPALGRKQDRTTRTTTCTTKIQKGETQ